MSLPELEQSLLLLRGSTRVRRVDSKPYQMAICIPNIMPIRWVIYQPCCILVQGCHHLKMKNTTNCSPLTHDPRETAVSATKLIANKCEGFMSCADFVLRGLCHDGIWPVGNMFWQTN